MLYILIYNDTTINEEEKIKHTEERADIDKEILDPLHQQVSQAVQILRQDIDRKPKILHLILLLISVCFVIVVSWFAKIRIRRQHTRAIDDIAAKQQQLVSQTIQEQQKQEILQQKNNDICRNNELIRQQYDDRRKQMLQSVENNCKAIRHSHDWKKELHWNDYTGLCETVNRHFFLFADKLKATGKLDEKEIRLCILVLLDMFSNRQLADILIYGESGMGTFKYRVSKKLNTSTKNLREYLLEIIVFGQTSTDKQ